MKKVICTPCGGHRNPYQLENAIKSSGTVFFISLGLSSLPVIILQSGQFSQIVTFTFSNTAIWVPQYG